MLSISGILTLASQCDSCHREYPLFTVDTKAGRLVRVKSATTIRRLPGGRDICSLCFDSDSSLPFFYYAQRYAIELDPLSEKPVRLSEVRV